MSMRGRCNFFLLLLQGGVLIVVGSRSGDLVSFGVMGVVAPVRDRCAGYCCVEEVGRGLLQGAGTKGPSLSPREGLPGLSTVR